MSPNIDMNGWNMTDGDQAVPVRSSEPVKVAAPTGPAMDIAQTPATHVVLKQQLPPNPASMKLSAFLGVGIVVVGMGFYFGFGSIAGELLNGGADQGKSVTITAAGAFSPQMLTVTPGSTFTLTNENADPQVIKSKNGRELFPVQVLFDQPYTVTVPTDANGTYVYFSETLPEDKTLTITVAASVATSSASSNVSSIDIPLPFGDNPPPAAPVSSSRSSISSSVSSSKSSTPTFEPTIHEGQATISLGGTSSSFSSSSSSRSSVASKAIPTNPYTVESGKAKESRSEELARTIQQQNLRSGAPLQQHKPTSVSTTGPAGTMALMLFPALIGVVLLYKKLKLQ